jgi:transposase InsO family protein
MIFGFIDEMRSKGYAVESVCRVLREQGCQVAARTYRAWKSRKVSARTVSDAKVVDVVRQIAWTKDRDGRKKMTPEGLYGRRKMTALVRRDWLPDASPGAVDRAMRLLGLSGVRRDKTVRTTVPAKDGRRAGDLVDRDFTAPAPNVLWVTDFTYVRTWSGWAYVVFIVDAFSCKIVAWHTQTRKDVSLVDIPLSMAAWARAHEGHPVPEGLIHHSDAGSQYTSLHYTEHLALEGIHPSIGSVGDAYDNALMESINGLYKAECIRTRIFHPGPYKTLADVEHATAAWVHWYNHDRLHTRLGMTSPVRYEHDHYATLDREPRPA